MTVGYGKEIQDEISKIEDLIQKNRFLKGKYPSRWLAVKLLEGDKEMTKLIDEKKR
jgi:Fe2+ transport system protein B